MAHQESHHKSAIGFLEWKAENFLRSWIPAKAGEFLGIKRLHECLEDFKGRTARKYPAPTWQHWNIWKSELEKHRHYWSEDAMADAEFATWGKEPIVLPAVCQPASAVGRYHPDQQYNIPSAPGYHQGAPQYGMAPAFAAGLFGMSSVSSRGPLPEQQQQSNKATLASAVGGNWPTLVGPSPSDSSAVGPRRQQSISTQQLGEAAIKTIGEKHQTELKFANEIAVQWLKGKELELNKAHEATIKQLRIEHEVEIRKKELEITTALGEQHTAQLILATEQAVNEKEELIKAHKAAIQQLGDQMDAKLTGELKAKESELTAANKAALEQKD